MGKQNFFIITTVVVIFLFFALPAQAINRIPPRWPDKETIRERMAIHFKKTCEKKIEIHHRFPRFFRIPRICKSKEEIKPPALEIYAEPAIIDEGESSFIQWAADNVFSCTASGGWNGEKDLSGDEEVWPLETTEYILTCESVDKGIERSTTVEVLHPEQSPEPEPEPEPELPLIINHLLISEVYYDVDSIHGAEPANEWVEIYNGTSVDVNISGWILEDNTSQDLIPEGTIVSNGGFIVLTASDTTSGFWGGVIMVNMGSSIGNGLANSSDAIFLKDTERNIIDSMSYGINISAFDPAAPDVAEGHSLARKNLSEDTDTAADWEDRESPSPGRDF